MWRADALRASGRSGPTPHLSSIRIHPGSLRHEVQVGVRVPKGNVRIKSCPHRLSLRWLGRASRAARSARRVLVVAQRKVTTRRRRPKGGRAPRANSTSRQDNARISRDSGQKTPTNDQREYAAGEPRLACQITKRWDQCCRTLLVHCEQEIVPALAPLASFHRRSAVHELTRASLQNA